MEVKISYSKQIVEAILKHIGSEDKSKWYVGIATNIRDRLFNEHNVDENDEDLYCYKKASSENEARDTEKHLLDNYAFKGDTGGGDKPEYVYAYKITSETRQ